MPPLKNAHSKLHSSTFVFGVVILVTEGLSVLCWVCFRGSRYVDSFPFPSYTVDVACRFVWCPQSAPISPPDISLRFHESFPPDEHVFRWASHLCVSQEQTHFPKWMNLQFSLLSFLFKGSCEHGGGGVTRRLKENAKWRQEWGREMEGGERCGAAAANLSGMLYFGSIRLRFIWFWSIFALHSDSGHWRMSPHESLISSVRHPPNAKIRSRCSEMKPLSEVD